jgi:hypothetical protein
VRTEDAARKAAAATSGAALGAIAGLLGAVVGAALSRRREEGKGLGWRIAIQRREEHRAGTRDRGYAGTSTTYGTSRPSEVPPPPSDPYHH